MPKVLEFHHFYKRDRATRGTHAALALRERYPNFRHFKLEFTCNFSGLSGLAVMKTSSR